MKQLPAIIVLCSASQPIVLAAAQALPIAAADWIQVLPAGAEFSGRDGRGPYRVPDVDALIAKSVAAMAGNGLIDENHSTDLALPRGEPAPARGWITELAARQGAVWAKVSWTAEGAKLLADKAYKFISPVFSVAPDGTIKELLRASLVNAPNLKGMAALHSFVPNSEETKMDFMAKLRKALKLPDDATEEAILAALGSAATTEMQAALAPIAKAAGVAETATAEQIVVGIGALKSGDTVLQALQADLAKTTTELNAIQLQTRTDKATAFVDGALKEGRAGLNKTLREHYISRHAASPEGALAVEKEITAMPKIGGGGTILADAPPAGEIHLNAADKDVARVLGISEADMLATRKREAEKAA